MHTAAHKVVCKVCKSNLLLIAQGSARGIAQGIAQGNLREVVPKVHNAETAQGKEEHLVL